MKKIIFFLSSLLTLSSFCIVLLISCQSHDQSKPYIYTVQSGDTLAAISRNSELPVKEIMRYNNLKNSRIFSGQIILLPNVSRMKGGDKMQQLEIVHRNIWGAQKPKKMNKSKGFNKITVHHTTENKEAPKRSEIHFLQSVQKYHINMRKWADIGYHFLIGKTGKIYEGRLLHYYGAHVKNNNTANIGIAMLGDFNSDKLNKAQEKSLKILIEALQEKYNIPEEKLFAHRELSNTSCPGDHTMEFLKDYRN